MEKDALSPDNASIVSHLPGGDVLRIGDIVILKHTKPNEGFLAAEGILSDDCMLVKNIKTLYDCLWQVRVQNQYSATTEYFEALMNLEEGQLPPLPGEAPGLAKTPDTLPQLLRSYQNEQRLNKKLMSMKLGKPVAFGDVIQLRHLKSKKFLTVSSSVLAKQERENMRVDLRTQGDSMSWLEFMPRYKYDREGQHIMNTSELYIRVHERSSEFIHAARKANRSTSEGEKEINCSLESSCWSLSIYQQARELHTKNLLIGNLVSLQEPESSTYITLDVQKPYITKLANVVMSSPVHISFASSDCYVGTNLLWMIEGEHILKGGIVSNRSEKISFRDLNTGLYMRLTGEILTAVWNRDERTLFEVVATQPIDSNHPVQEGSLVQLYTKGGWLTSQKSVKGAHCCLTNDRSAALSLIIATKLHRTVGVHLFVGVEGIAVLRHFEQVVKSSDVFSMPPSIIEQTFRSLFSSLDHLANFLLPPEEAAAAAAEDEESGVVTTVEHTNVAALNPITAATMVIRQTMMREQGILDGLLDVIDLMNIMSQEDFIGHLQSREEKGSDERLSYNKSEESRRSTIDFHWAVKQATQSNALEFSIALQRSASRRDIGGHVDTDVSTSLRNENEDISSSIKSVFQDIIQGCLHVVSLSISRNHVNQMYISDKFTVLLNLVKEHDIAVKCVQEMLRDNLQMLQTKIRDREIQLFLELLRETEMNVTILQLLRSTCSCPMGVDSTQRMVANALFGYVVRKIEEEESRPAPKLTRRPRTIIKWSDSSPMAGFDMARSVSLSAIPTPRDIVSDNILDLVMEVKEFRKVEWPDKRMYLPSEASATGSGGDVLGKELVEEGVPRISVIWSSKGEYSMMTLFGCRDRVPFEFLCNLSTSEERAPRLHARKTMITATDSTVSVTTPPANNTHQKKNTASSRKKKHTILVRQPSNRRLKRRARDLKMKSIIERKLQVADYFVAQMYLAAELCLDRNYVAIGLLEKAYSYEMLITMMRSSHVPPSFKAPVCRLMRCLYVDREPQVEAKFPRLIKTSVSLSGGEENAFNDHHSGSPYMFGLLQQFISDYLHNQLDTTKCDELSAEMVDLLLALMKFGFYNTAEQIQDIINPLITALDDHKNNVSRFALTGRIRRHSSLSIFGSNSNILGGGRGGRMLRGLSFKKPVEPAPPSPTVMGGKYDRTISRSMSFGEEVQNRMEIMSKWANEKIQTLKEFRWNKSKMPKSWEAATLNMMNSVGALGIVLLFVICTSVISAVQLVQDRHVSNSYLYFDIIVSLLFISELSVRVYCSYAVHKELWSFVRNVFNVLDIFAVSLDFLIMIFTFEALKGHLTSTLRTLRILRLIRIIRVARLLKKIAEKRSVAPQWVLPTRYASITSNEARTIAGILRVLSIIHDRIQDKKLSIFIKAFVVWYDADMAGKPCDASLTYSQVVESEQSLAATIPKKIDQILLDVVMYNDAVLVQEALQLLLLHKSEEQLLHQTLKRVQIIMTPKMEMKYKNINNTLRQIIRMAEAFEVWGNLKGANELLVADQAYDAFCMIRDYMTVSTVPKEIDLFAHFDADSEVQQMLINMDAMSCFMTLQSALLDASLGEPRQEIKKIIKACNDAIIYFVMNNPTSQAIVFKHLTWFLERCEAGANSSKVVKAVLQGNRTLIKQCPRKYLAEFVQKIINNGRKPEYLDIFVGLTDVSETGDSGITALRSEISRHITNVDRSSYIITWCSGVTSKGYAERADMMRPYQGSKHVVKDDELPLDLQYHINLIQLLVGCKLGPKLQAVYQLDHAVAAIIDPVTIYNVRRGLGLLLLEMVETRVDGLDASEAMWNFFEHTIQFFEVASIEMPSLLKRAESNALLLQNIEWTRICCQIIQSFFGEFDIMMFAEYVSYDGDEGLRITLKDEKDIKSIINKLYNGLQAFKVKMSKILSGTSRTFLEETLMHIPTFAVDDNMISATENTATTEGEVRTYRSRGPARRGSLEAEIQQVNYRRLFSVFVDSVFSSRGNDAAQRSIGLFDKIPSQTEAVNADVRLEPLLLKVSTHIRTRLQRTTLSRQLDKAAVDTALWTMRSLRHLLEKCIGHTVEQIADPEWPSDLAIDTSWPHGVMDDYGVTFLCLDLIAVGIDTTLSVESVKLLIVLLAKHGGNIDIQKTVLRYLTETDSALFFEQIKELLEQQTLWFSREAEYRHDTEHGGAIILPDEVMVLSLLHKMCDGNFESMKTFIRDQESNSRFVNIIECLTGYMDTLSRYESHYCTKAAIRVAHTINGLLQGPCKGNQEQFVLHTELLVALNRLIRASRPSQDFTAAWEKDLETLKEYVIDVLRACIESQTIGSVVLERVQTVIELNVLNVLIIPSETDEFGDVVDLAKLSRLQAKYLVFLQTLDDSRTDIPSHVKARIDGDIGHVEVLWNKVLHLHYFHVPEIAKDLPQSSLENLIRKIDFSTQESKLLGFIRRAKDLHREAVHQKKLKTYGIGNLWWWKHVVNYVLFANIIAMNIMMLGYYTTKPLHDNGHDNGHNSTGFALLNDFDYLSGGGASEGIHAPSKVHLPQDIYFVLYVMNGGHILLSIIMLFIVMIIHIPVNVQVKMDDGHALWTAVMYGVRDILLLWYLCHATLAILAFFVHPLFLSLLLLEFVALDSASTEVMYAVIYPFRQLLTTLIIIVIFLQIFACLIFFLFRDEFLHLDCETMWDSFKLMLSYGFRSEEGIGRYMIETISIRIITDVLFYFVIVVILRNIFFGIIIDTFGELRSVRMDREADFNVRCFICGLEQSEFDKKADTTMDFKNHRTCTHNMWNYLYFTLCILEQPREQDSSLEIQVRKCIESADVGWFPIGLVGIKEKPVDAAAKETDKGYSFDNSNTDAAESIPHSGFAQRLSLIRHRLSVTTGGTGGAALAAHSESTGDDTLQSVISELETLDEDLNKMSNELVSVYSRLAEMEAKYKQSGGNSNPNDADASEAESKSVTPKGPTLPNIKGPTL